MLFSYATRAVALLLPMLRQEQHRVGAEGAHVTAPGGPPHTQRRPGVNSCVPESGFILE